MISELSGVTLDSGGETKQRNHQQEGGKLLLGNDYRRVSSSGSNKLHFLTLRLWIFHSGIVFGDVSHTERIWLAVLKRQKHVEMAGVRFEK